MDVCLRSVLGAMLLLGCLQAQPLDFAVLKRLITDVRCDPKVNFTSPTEVKDHCLDAAQNIIAVGLNRSKEMCKDPSNRIDRTVKKLKERKALKALKEIPESPSTNSTDCTWEDEGSQKPFEKFVEDIELFMKLINNNS